MDEERKIHHTSVTYRCRSIRCSEMGFVAVVTDTRVVSTTKHTTDRIVEVNKDELEGLTIAQGVRSPALYKLLMAGGFFAFTAI